MGLDGSSDHPGIKRRLLRASDQRFARKPVLSSGLVSKHVFRQPEAFSDLLEPFYCCESPKRILMIEG
jgi:hypothetical protein